MPPRPIRWLHLSDLHVGCRGEDLWWQMLEEWEPSVRQMAGQLGPPDLVLISGDLANRGLAAEYAKVDRLLDSLLGWLHEETKAEAPLIVTVPGNHDLRRPTGLAKLQFEVLDRYDRGADDPGVALLEKALWDQGKPGFVARPFSAYQKWFQERISPNLVKRAKLYPSHFPGDFCLEVAIPDAFPLCLVGLNSTWQQYRDGDFKEKLTIPRPQLQAALPPGGDGDPLAVFKRHDRRILMWHHPPDWLSERGCAFFDADIYPAGRFDLCIHGHMHKPRFMRQSFFGGSYRDYFQAPSLFGLEHYGTRKEERLFGYAWGTLAEDGEVRAWVLTRIQRGDGSHHFGPDQRFPALGAVFRPGKSAGPAPSLSLPPPKVADFTKYLDDLLDQVDHINITGIATAGKGALRFSIEKLYTPLRIRGERIDLSSMLRLEGSSDRSQFAPRYRLLFEGQPGAGKTTFLNFIATMLARDVLGHSGPPGPPGTSWCERYLGLRADLPRTPVLLKIADLLPLWRDQKTRLRRDDRRRFLDLLEQSSKENEQNVDREAWKALFEGDRGLLLLDGLDEVADEGLRARVFAVFRDACQHWKCPIVVTSRPIQTAELETLGFHRAVVEPFGDAEIRTFIDHWVAGLNLVERPEALRGGGERYRQVLTGAICDFPRVRRLATNPVMLTCLCVVHWHEGRLPEGRSRVYQAVIKWLIGARTALREGEGFTDRFAWNAFARLGLAMLNTEKAKQTVFDLEAAAVAVDLAVQRQFPDLSPEDRRKEARSWLRFECLGSGIVEEVAGNRLRFWHLTFQEFLAALQLAWRDDGEDGEASWWPLVRDHLDNTQWRETIELFPGCLLDEGGEGRVDKLLDRILALRGKKPDLAADARVAGIMGRLLQALTAYQYRPRPGISRSNDASLARSMAIFEREGAAQVAEEIRIAAAEALGRGGDPRLTPEKDNFLPVPGLTVRLGKYPVTVEEYQRFVDSRGYEEPKYWDPAGWALKQKQAWEAPGSWDEQLQNPNRPATEVSWYEAIAYCRWLSEQKRFEVRLPTEAEWESAATPAQGKYPWGTEEPNSERANFGGKNGRPTPVGIYPAGNGRHHHCDLAGNVWEWCAGEVDLSDEADLRERRGGAWSSPAESLRVNYRIRRWAWDRHVAFGFRVAAAPASIRSGMRRESQ